MTFDFRAVGALSEISGLAPSEKNTRSSSDSSFSLADARSETPERTSYLNEAGMHAVNGMRPPELVETSRPDDPFVRSLAAPARGLPAEAHEDFARFRWLSAPVAPGLHLGAGHAPNASQFGLTTSGSVLPDGDWSGLVVTQPHGPGDGDARIRAQLGGSTGFDLPGDLEGRFKANAAIESDAGASMHADIAISTGGGTGIGAAITAGRDGVAHEAYVQQRIAEQGTVSARVIQPAGEGPTEWRLRYDEENFRAEFYHRGEETGVSVNARMRF